MDALVTQRLCRDFHGRRVVNDLSLTVPRGSMYGLLGPNGAGKTTTLSMVTGLLRPSWGRVEVLGHDVWSDPAGAKALIGVLPDGLPMFDRLSGRELLRYVGLLRGMPAELVTQRSVELLATLGLQGEADKLVVDYSAGMTKKIGLACALIHAPRLLLLDEPFEAVDPVSGEVIRTILREFVSGGGTVVLSSHVMELVERLCDHVAIIDQGRLVAVGTLDEVRAGQSLQDRFVSLVQHGALSQEGLAWLRSSSD